MATIFDQLTKEVREALLEFGYGGQTKRCEMQRKQRKDRDELLEKKRVEPISERETGNKR